MLEKGASGFWERWDQDTQDANMNGQGFQMLAGDLSAWFFQCLAGINPVESDPGFKETVLKPQIEGDLTYVKSSYCSMYGNIVSNWQRDARGEFTWQISIPANTTATVFVPTKNVAGVQEGGGPARKAPGCRFLRAARDAAVFQVEAGSYSFRSIYSPITPR